MKMMKSDMWWRGETSGGKSRNREGSVTVMCKRQSERPKKRKRGTSWKMAFWSERQRPIASRLYRDLVQHAIAPLRFNNQWNVFIRICRGIVSVHSISTGTTKLPSVMCASSLPVCRCDISIYLFGYFSIEFHEFGQWLVPFEVAHFLLLGEQRLTWRWMK